MTYVRQAGLFVVILALFATVASLSARPVYRATPLDTGIVMLTFVHSANRTTECRRLTPAEIAKLPPNMRKTTECPRERRAVYVELDLNGRTIYARSLPPTGIAGDGPSRVYERFVVPTGNYQVRVRMRDTLRSHGFDHTGTADVMIKPDQMFLVDFRPASREFLFR